METRNLSVVAPPSAPPRDGRAVFFVVEPDRDRLVDLGQRLTRTPGKTINCVVEGRARQRP